MNIRAMTWIPLLAALLSLVARSEDAPPQPVWELQARLNEETSAAFAGVVGETLDFGDLTPGANTTVRVAGFVNRDTPESDWLAEIGGLPGVEELIADFGEGNSGKIILEEDGIGLAIWSEVPGTLRMVSPAANANRKFSDAAPLRDGVWMSGSVDLARIGADTIHSRLLKLPQKISFTASDAGADVSVEIRATMQSAEAAAEALAWIQRLQELLAEPATEGAVGEPRFSAAVKDQTVVVRLRYAKGSLANMMEEIRLNPDAPSAGESPNTEPHH